MILGNTFSHNNKFYNESYFKDLKTYYDLNTKIFKWSIFTLILLTTFIVFTQLENYLDYSYKKISFSSYPNEITWVVDGCIVMSFTLLHLIIRAVVINCSLVSVYNFINRSSSLRVVKFVKLKSLVEQIYYFVYYTSMVVFGYTIFYNTFIAESKTSIGAVWGEVKKIFIPHSLVKSKIKSEVLLAEQIHPRYNMMALNLYYLVQISSYLYQLIYIVLNLETKRKDYYQMIVHHVVTLILTVGSYVCSFANVGTLLFGCNRAENAIMGVENLKYVGHTVMIVTDTTDLFLSLSKIFNYLTTLPFEKMKYSPKKAKVVKKLIANCCDFVFLFGFVISWILGRHLLYNIVVYNCFTKLIPTMDLNLKTSDFNLGFAYRHLILVTSLIWLLLCLQSLQIIWCFMILKLVYRVVRKKTRTSTSQENEKDIGDIRSDDEVDTDDDVEEDEDYSEKIVSRTISKESNNNHNKEKEFSLLNVPKNEYLKRKSNISDFYGDNASEITLAKETDIDDIVSCCED